jgi:hypothetical protein
VREIGSATELGDLALGETEIEAQQHGACADARIEPLAAAIDESEHLLVERDVPGIHLDEEIEAAVDAARVDVRDVEERGEHGLGPNARLDRELRELTTLAPARAKAVDLLAIELVDEESGR